MQHVGVKAGGNLLEKRQLKTADDECIPQFLENARRNVGGIVRVRHAQPGLWLGASKITQIQTRVVNIGDLKSNLLMVPSGVPRGFILGTFLTTTVMTKVN